MHRPLRAAALALVVAIVAAALFARPWFAAPAAAPTRDVTIPRGATLAGAARRLETAGVVTSATRFRLLARLFGSSAPIRAGEYRFVGGSWSEHLARMQQGRTIQRFVTIPEGLPAALVAARLAAVPELTGPAPTPPEGRVLPQTYAYAGGERRAAVLARMTAAMDSALAELWPRRSPRAAVRTPHEALTLASIVEKETAIPSERRTIAGVYSNRLRIGMKLDADPTVIYPVTRGRPLGRPIRRSELAADNGYNTYLKPGLPLGPIANPSRAALAAVLDPADTPALYFVADGRGGHVFAATLAEQSRNVAAYRARRAAAAR